MGFEAPGTGQKLDFTGTRLEGLEVTVDSASVGMLLDIMADYEAVTGEDVKPGEAIPVIRRLLENFGELLEEWNVERKGRPVPASYEGLRQLDINFVVELIGAWLTGTTDPGDELGKDSTSGENLPGGPTAAAAALSRSLPS